MPKTVEPEDFIRRVHAGHERLRRFRRARVMYLRQYVGSYYDRDRGEIGNEPLNLIFNAIRVLLPNLVLSFPTHKVTSKFMRHQFYADLLGLALDQNSKDLKIKDTYRRVIVDSLFAMGILKTGLSDSNQAIYFDEDDPIDPGEVYTEAVDFDNFVFDPGANRIKDGLFVGDRIVVPRQPLLDSGFYDNDALVKLPSAAESRVDKRADDLSNRKADYSVLHDFQDEIALVECWVPEANAIVTVPDVAGYTDQYLRVEDYHGPKEGPYTFLNLSPPVPANPLHVVPVGIWYDLHVLANRMAKKIIEQAERQKDVGVYRPSNADDAESVKEAADGEMVAVDNPESVNTLSFGGQNPSNMQQIANLQIWFNEMAANPQATGGRALDADSATEAQILQQNAGVGLEDMKDLVYTMAQEEGEKRAWYFHTDPFLNVPLTKRIRVGQRQPDGSIRPGRRETVQLTLTPEMREGDFLDYNFAIEPESLGRVDSTTRQRRLIEFFVNVVPSVATAAQILAQLGQPMSVQRVLTLAAKNLNIDWIDEVFDDPEVVAVTQALIDSVPDAAGSQAIPAAQQTNPKARLQELLQQGGQLATTKQVRPASVRSDAQRGAAGAQADLLIR
ncbi:MAG: hypothetical protein AAGG38_02145 [Planctomycetota bacterium]